MKLDSMECAGRLLSKPSEESSDVVVDRVDSRYKDHSDRFRHVNKDFSRQYFHFYAQRLSSMKPLLLSNINRKWGKTLRLKFCVSRLWYVHSMSHLNIVSCYVAGNRTPIKTLADLKDDNIERCIIVGTLYKHQELKPSILKEISDEHQLIPQPVRTHFTDDQDELILEDELQRIKLIGELSPHEVITGVVCSVMGAQAPGGKFNVEDYCFPTPCAPMHPLTPTDEDRYSDLKKLDACFFLCLAWNFLNFLFTH